MQASSNIARGEGGVCVNEERKEKSDGVKGVGAESFDWGHCSADSHTLFHTHCYISSHSTYEQYWTVKMMMKTSTWAVLQTVVVQAIVFVSLNASSYEETLASPSISLQLVKMILPFQCNVV